MPLADFNSLAYGIFYAGLGVFVWAVTNAAKTLFYMVYHWRYSNLAPWEK